MGGATGRVWPIMGGAEMDWFLRPKKGGEAHCYLGDEGVFLGALEQDRGGGSKCWLGVGATLATLEHCTSFYASLSFYGYQCTRKPRESATTLSPIWGTVKT